MALYEHKEAQLGELQGIGYLFLAKNARAKAYQGVFFSPEGEGSALESLVEETSVAFRGVLYKRTQSGTVSSQEVEVSVSVSDFGTVSMGDRASLSAVEE